MLARTLGLKTEPISSGVEDPGVVVGALDTGVQSEGFARQLSCSQWAWIGQGAEWLALHITFFFPFLEVSERVDICWFLNPFQNLYFCQEIYIIVLLQGFNHPVHKNFGEAFVNLEPGGVKAQAQRCPVGDVVPVEVVPDHPGELILVVNVGTGRHEVTARKSFIK